MKGITKAILKIDLHIYNYIQVLNRNSVGSMVVVHDKNSAESTQSFRQMTKVQNKLTPG